MSSLFQALLSLPLLLVPPTAPVLHDDAERDHHPAYVALATGDWEEAVPRVDNRYPWPVKVLSIGHTVASYQNYGGGLSGAYFHHGIDIRADAGSTVVASVGGKVVNVENYVPGNAAYWEVAILDDDGFIWQYHHIDRASIPAEVHAAFKNGGRVPQGAKLGEVYYWGVVTFGERYHHVHLNVLGKERAYVNPMGFLEPLDDDAGPRIEEIGIVRSPESRSSEKGYTLFAVVSDLILHEKFTVPPHSLEMSVDGAASVGVWSFDTLPGGASNTRFVHDLFVPGKTCGNYQCRKSVINLGFKPNPAQVFPMAPGSHRVVVKVKDLAGNEDSRAFEWANP